MELILGISKKEMLFSVYLNEDLNKYDIYLGLYKFITIPNDPKSFIFKSTIVILYNSGIRIKDIENAFKITFKTIKKYVEAFEKTEDDKELEKLLKNPGRTIYKITDDVLTTIHEKILYYESLGQKYFNSKVIIDIKEMHCVEISTEIIRRERRNLENNRQVTTQHPDIEIIKEDRKKIIPVKNKIKIVEEAKIQKGTYFRNSYAGVLILSAFINIIFDNFPKIVITGVNYLLKSIIKYWVIAIILGAKNFEMLRYFNIKDFEYICGYQDFPSVEQMRIILKNISFSNDVKLVSYLIRTNIEYFIERDNNYYIDGHFEEYTGKADILKGWNTKKNRVTKGNTDYFIHDGKGNPITTILIDQFYDFREIIRIIVKKIQRIFKNKENFYIYDRGGFSSSLMKEISESKNQYFITWQKGFKQEDVKDHRFEKKLVLSFPYNDLGKYKSYEIKLAESRWKCKDFECRRIIIKKQTENKDVFYQSILTNNESLDAKHVAAKILKRFIQENDFKKQKNHFGIGEITSYRKLKYGELGDKDEKKMTINNEYKDKLKEIKKLKSEKIKICQKIGLEIYNESILNTLSIEFLEKHSQEIERIKEISKKNKEEKDKLGGIEKKISKLKKCKNEEKMELDLRAKMILNVVKIIARNIVENGAKDFLCEYKNLRDYQKVFRQLIRTSGYIKHDGDLLKIKLDSFGRKNFKNKCNKFFNNFNNKSIKSLNGNYKIYIENFQ